MGDYFLDYDGATRGPSKVIEKQHCRLYRYYYGFCNIILNMN